MLKYQENSNAQIKDGGGDPPATQYALRVALQTMKDRCQSLQKRLNTLEDENQKLRAGKDDVKSTLPTASVGFAAENFQLRLQLADLQRQKTQLTEQINMVSTENRKLWSRLSQMAKEQGAKDHDCTLTNNNCGMPELVRSSSSSSNQNLIRSKTFTQHNPNPNLRLKIISNENDGDAVSNVTMLQCKDLSLEEVALNTGAGEEEITKEPSELGFSYLNIDESNFGESINISETDFQLEAKKCNDGLHDLRREALHQQKDLQLALKALQSRLVHISCPECVKKSMKPEMADKSLETDESLSEVLQDRQMVASSNIVSSSNEILNENITRINFIEEKINADAMIKTCPMCGKLYNKNVTFQSFCEHVESHFNMETSDFGSMAEHDFEYVSNIVGNF